MQPDPLRPLPAQTLMMIALCACGGARTDAAPSEHDPDGDGAVFPDDCDGYEAAAYPGAEEVCDGFDNNCDGLSDEGCPLEPNADWTVIPRVLQDCTGIAGSFDFEDLVTEDDEGTFTVAIPGPSYGSWSHLGGSRTDGLFDASLTIAGTCVYDLGIEGELLSPNDLEATFRFTVLGGSCGDCVDTAWSLRGLRSHD